MGAQSLPHGLTEPLHYQSPAWLLLPIAILLALASAFALWWFLRRTRQAAQPEDASGSGRGRAASAGGLKAEIEALRARFAETGDYRSGCHALALLLRDHFTRKRGRRLLPLTAKEIGPRLSDMAIGSLFELIADLQYRRRPPQHDDFDGVCDLARESTKGKP